MTVVAVLGPTAAGKSDLGVALAQALGGEVVNADSMQLYRGMDVGTAKLRAEDRGDVEHHLLDVLDPRQEASVAAYQRDSRAVVDRLISAGRASILVGGSGLYVTAALDEMDFPGTDAVLRAQLEAELALVGAPSMHARLAAVDPDAAARILPGNGRRSVRALEVVTLTGGPFAASLPAPRAHYPAVLIGLAMPREVLGQRIAARVDRMWQLGLVEEVRGLAAAGLREGRTASRALGYAQVLRLLDGQCDEAQARQETVRATRRLARRQESWFRRDARITWLDGTAPALVGRALEVARRPR